MYYYVNYDNKAEVKKAVVRDKFALYWASPRLKDDEEIVKLAIYNNLEALEYASERLKDNEEIIKLAITKDIRALRYASERLKDNKEIIKLAISNDVEALEYASKRLKEDEEIIKLAITKDIRALRYVSERLKDNKEIIKLAVSKNSYALEYASERLKDNEEIVKLAILKNGYALQFASKRLQDNEEIVKLAILKNGYALQFASKRLQDNEEIVKLAITKNSGALQYASRRLQDKEAIVAIAVGKGPEFIKYASNKQQKNPNILFFMLDDYSNYSDEELISKNLAAFPYLDLNKDDSIRVSNATFKMIDMKRGNIQHLATGAIEFSEEKFEIYCRTHYDTIKKFYNKYYKLYKENVVSKNKKSDNLYNFMKVMINDKNVLQAIYASAKYTISDVKALSLLANYYDDKVQETFKKISSGYIEKYRNIHINIYNTIIMNTTNFEMLDTIFKNYGFNENNIYDYIINNKYFDKLQKSTLLTIVNNYYGKSIRVMDIFNLLEEMTAREMTIDEILEEKNISKKDFNKIYASAKENNQLLYNFIFDSLSLNKIRGFKKLLKFTYKVLKDDFKTIEEYNKKYTNINLYDLLKALKKTELYNELYNKVSTMPDFDISKLEEKDNKKMK